MLIVSNSAKDTKGTAEILAEEALKEKGPVVIALKGDLGSGKTTFVQGFARGLGIKQKTLSPTFVIYRKYNIPRSMETRPLEVFYHFDCYRIKKSKELLDLRFNNIVSNPKNIILIEWPEKIKKLLSKNTLWLKFKFIDGTTREILC